MWIPRIGRTILIWNKVFFKLRLSFDALVIRKEIFSESGYHIETNLDAVVEVLEVQISVTFDLCFDEELIEFCWDDLMFDSTHATTFCIITTFQWWGLFVSRYQSGRVLGLWWFHIVCWRIWIFILMHHIFNKYHGFVKFRVMFVKFKFILLYFIIRILPVVVNSSLYE